VTPAELVRAGRLTISRSSVTARPFPTAKALPLIAPVLGFQGMTEVVQFSI
jgi:hypothetical protein